MFFSVLFFKNVGIKWLLKVKIFMNCYQNFSFLINYWLCIGKNNFEVTSQRRIKTQWGKKNMKRSPFGTKQFSNYESVLSFIRVTGKRITIKIYEFFISNYRVVSVLNTHYKNLSMSFECIRSSKATWNYVSLIITLALLEMKNTKILGSCEKKNNRNTIVNSE